MVEVRTIFIALDGSSSRPFINLETFFEVFQVGTAGFKIGTLDSRR